MGQFIIKGCVKGAFLCKPLSEVRINLYSSNNLLLKSVTTDRKGRFKFAAKNISFVEFYKEGFTKKQIQMQNSFPALIRLLEDKIIGYQGKHSFTPGDTITVYAHSPEKYTAELYRNGLQIEKIMEIGLFEPIIQEVPDRCFVDTGLNWMPSFQYILSEQVTSGFYTLRLTSAINKEKIYNITFVVSPKKETYGNSTRLLVLASTNNWQTYNIWGGRSRYRNLEDSSYTLKYPLKGILLKSLPEFFKFKLRRIVKNNIIVSIQDHPDHFQFKRLSIRRPHPNCSINSLDPYQPFTSHLAEGEWRILAWLEKNNYSYDVISGFELHNDPDLLNNYSTVILNTHSEYWSKNMYYGLKTFFNNGGNILNLSGNSIYREIEYYDDASLHCVSLRFDETVEDETQLIGVRFDMSGYGSCASYKVLAPGHWIFENTKLKLNDEFGTKSLNNRLNQLNPDFIKDPASRPGMARLTGKGGSGWETDKLSKTAPSDIILVAKGTNNFNGGSDMIIREPKEHGLLFSASSITFGGTLLIDDNCSIILTNILNKINVKIDEITEDLVN